MELYHNSRATEYRSPYGAVPVGTALRLRLDVKIAEPERVFLRLWTGQETLVPMKRTTEGQYEAEILTPK